MLAFHFTHIDNLDSILEHGLLSTNLKNEMEVGHQNVANNHIQQTRSQIIIDTQLKLRNRREIWDECQVLHSLHDFVPFYFALKCPMLFQILTSKNIEQSDMIFIAIDPKKCLADLDEVYFSDASINRANDLPNLYSNEADLVKLNWAEIKNIKRVESENLKHQRMAEFLVKDVLALEYIDHIIVWSKGVKQNIIDLYNKKSITPPSIQFAEAAHHYYQEPEAIFGGRKWDYSAVVGPTTLLSKTVEYYNNTLVHYEANKNNKAFKFRFKNLAALYEALFKDPNLLKEVSDAYGITMDYGHHKATIKVHSYNVHNNLFKIQEFNYLDENDQLIAKLSSLLHDIGKGPASRWKNNRMTKPDWNHSAKSLPMLLRILSTEVEDITEDQISKIFMCVTYDDLIGEIVGKGRDKEQLFVFTDSVDEVNLLFAVGKADMKDVYEPWLEEHKDALDALYEEAIQRVEQNA